jgi:Ca-activated chloride channel family protein
MRTRLLRGSLFCSLTLSLCLGGCTSQQPLASSESEPSSQPATRTLPKAEEGDARRYAVAGPSDNKDALHFDDEAAKGVASEPAAPPPALMERKAMQDQGGLALGSGQGYGAGRSKTLAKMAPAPTAALMPLQAPSEFNTEGYKPIAENHFVSAVQQPLSTFSIDVDTASYSNARRFLSEGSLPPKDAIRVEEWLNYFSYDYEPPTDDRPFAVHTEVARCPWNENHELVRIGIQGKTIAEQNVPPRNLVFLIDVSGSMMSQDKLPLVKQGLSMLSEQLRPQDSIAMVVYAGASGLVLPATSGRERGKILSALEELQAGGSTNGADGIRLAYRVAQDSFKQGGINRVILTTDGDFNVGTTSQGELQRLIEDKRNSGVFLTVLGFGTGNVKDDTMELLADKGNGNYAYIDSAAEAHKVLVREAGATLVTIAKDVKLQTEFNPALVQSYKLIGYENRLLAKEDFNDDRKDAGEIGAGHSVTALYEVVPVGAPNVPVSPVDPLKYQSRSALAPAAASGELLTVSVRYKLPQASSSTKFSVVVHDDPRSLASASRDFRFSAAVANVAMLLRGAPDVQHSNLQGARLLAQNAIGSDPHGDRAEFVSLVDRAIQLGLAR